MARGFDQDSLSSLRRKKKEVGQENVKKSLNILSDPYRYEWNSSGGSSPYVASDALINIYAPSISDIVRPDYRYLGRKRGKRPRPPQFSSALTFKFPRDKDYWTKGVSYKFLDHYEIDRLLNDSDAYLKAYEELVAVTNFIEDHDHHLKDDLANFPAQSDFYLPFIERCEGLLSFVYEASASANYKDEATLWQRRKMKKNREKLFASYQKLTSIWESVWSLEVDEKA